MHVLFSARDDYQFEGWLSIQTCTGGVKEQSTSNTTIIFETANVGNLPLLLIPALCMEPTSPFKNREVCIKNGMAYISFTLATATLLQWTYTYSLLKPKPDDNKSINAGSVDTTVNSSHVVDEIDTANTEELALINTSNHEFPNDSNWSMSYFSGSSFSKAILWKKIMDHVGNIPWRDIANPPVISVVVAVFIGTIPAFKRILTGNNAPLRVVGDALATVGGAMLPSLILLLGGNLYQGLGSAKIKGKVLAAIVITKLLLVPLGGVIIVQAAVRLGWTPSDPLYELVLYMHYAMPSAMTIGIMTQLFGGSNDLSLIMFWCYLPSILTITVWTILYIHFIF